MEYNGFQGRTGSSRTMRTLLAVLRAIVVLLLLAAATYLLWRGHYPALIVWLLTIIFLLDNSINILFGFYDVEAKRRSGFMFWLASIFMGTQSVQLVTPDGETKTVRPAQPLASIFARLGAPGIVIIENGNAVVFEQSGKYTRFSGPGIVFNRRFERIARVVSLFPRYCEAEIQDVQTKDGWQINILPLQVRYQVIGSFDREERKFTCDESVILSLVYDGGYLHSSSKALEPDARVMQLVERTVRDVLAGKRIRDIFGASASSGEMELSSRRQTLLDTILDRAQSEANQFGVQLQAVDFGRIEVPKVYLELQVAWARRETIEEIAEGLSTAIADMLQLQEELNKRQAEPQTIVMLATLLERVVQNVMNPSSAESGKEPLPPATPKHEEMRRAK